MPSLLLVLFPVLVGIALLHSAVRVLLSPSRDVPGPFLARFTRLWYLREIHRGKFHETNIELHKKHGPIVRIAPGQYSINDPGAIKEIYGLGNEYPKSAWYYAAGNPNPHEAELFADRDPEHHSTQRRKVAAAYSMSNLVQLEPFVDSCSSLFCTRLSEFAAAGQKLPLGLWLQYYAFDVIGEVTVGRRFGFLDQGKDISGIMGAIEQYLWYISHVGVYSELHPFLYRLQTRLSTKSKGVGAAAITDFTARQLAERISVAGDEDKKAGQGDFLSKLLKLHRENPEKVSMRDVRVACETNIGAGSDTTGISLSSVMYHLYTHPVVLAKLRKELDDKAEAGEISDPITFAQAQTCSYLQAVIKEALRVHPAAGLPLMRVVPEGGRVVAGRKLTAGSAAGINAWVMHTNEDVFGPDASSFNPDRWTVSKERSAYLDRHFFSFGMGSRTCIGKNISMLEMSKLVPQIVRQFDMQIESVWRQKTHWFVKPQDFGARIVPRAS